MELGGRPLARYAVEAVRGCEEVGEIVVVVAPEDVERARRELLGGGSGKTERVVAGGKRRQESVRAGLGEVSAGCDLVVVHDAARPFVRGELVRRCLREARLHGAAVAAVAATDTVKEVGREGEVTATLDRSRLWLAQTPQAFRYELLVEAHEEAAKVGFEGTDDAALVERLGRAVRVVPGDPDNTKITCREDLLEAERRLSGSGDKARREGERRTGIGYDAHRFAESGSEAHRSAEGRPLVLGGVRFPGERGLLGHSDADVVSHAICDALLGASGLGDIGGHFPDTDPRYAGISSLSLLVRAAEMVREAGWEIENVDAVAIAEAPRIAGRAEEMRGAVAGALGIGCERVSLKGTTTEGMGFTGRGEGIASQAVALLKARE